MRTREAAALSAAFWLVVLALPALPGVPVNDDWAYASSAYGLAKEGTLRLSDWGTPTLVVQAAWGALFSRLLGPTASALRLSTLILAWLAVLSLLSLLKKEKARLEAAALLIVSPLFLALAPSFMTDVPALSLGLIGLALAAPGEGERRPGRLFAAGCLFALAYGVRQNYAVLPIILAAARRDRRAAVLLLAPLAAFAAAHAGWLRWVHGPTLNRYPLLFGAELAAPWPVVVALRLLAGALYAGLFALPFSLAGLLDDPRRRFAETSRARWALALLPLPFAFMGGHLPLPRSTSREDLFGTGLMDVCSYLSPQGLGCWMIEGQSSRVAPPWLPAALTAAALLGWAGLALCWPSRRERRPGVLVASLAALAAAVLPAGSFFDRYWLPLAPAALAAGAAGFSGSPRATRVLRASGLLCALLCWAAAADYMRATRAAWGLGETAVSLGIGPARVKASLDWCWANDWEPEVNIRKLLGIKDPTKVPLICAREPKAVVSFKAVLRKPRPLLAQASFFSPLTLRRETLYLYAMEENR